MQGGRRGGGGPFPKEGIGHEILPSIIYKIFILSKKDSFFFFFYSETPQKIKKKLPTMTFSN